MNKQIKLNVMPVFFTILLALTPVAEINAANLQLPQQIIANISEALQKKLQDKSFTQNFAHVSQFVNDLIEPHTDFNRIAPLVLGKHWNSASAADQQRFTHEFQTLIVRAYARAFVEYKNWTISFLPFQMGNETTKTMVKTRVLQPRIQPVEVDYRMLLDNGAWKVYDIVIDGVSLVTTYRSSFSDEIQKMGSLSAVIDDLAQRNVKGLASK